LQLIDGQPVFSATDLVGYLACEHLTALERAALAGLVERPHLDDPELDVIRRRGEQHEERYLAELEADGRRVVRIERERDGEERLERLHRQADETIAAMHDGADVIYQATFFDGRWLGYADFLLRVDDLARPSAWGTWHYEVADTKLARHVKASAVLQICSYVEQLERLQGVLPRCMHVVLGGSAHEQVSFRVDDFMAYFRAAKTRFEAATLGTDGQPAPMPAYPPDKTYPEPVEHCDVCRWRLVCEGRRRADDHLSLVAGIGSRQRKALVERGVETVASLASAPLPFDPPLEGTSAPAVERVHEQARIQVEGREQGKLLYELLLPKAGEPIEAERGLATLPEPDPGDLFFDIEGDPYAADDGLDYLFGVLDTDRAFTATWSFDPERPDASADVTLAGEKAAFEQLMDFFMDRLERHPGMHIYHYAAYEPTALKRLMGRHATREAEVDQLLRGGVLVDLYRAVHQGLRASVESYSIKKIEPLYGFQREIDLRDAGSSIVAFEEWLQLGEGDRPGSEILQHIADYNRDDVVSTLRLRAWLEGLRVELATETGQEVPRPAERSMDAPEQVTAADERVQALADRLTAGVPVDARERTPDEHARWLLAQLLSWHRREAKVAYWEFFERLGMGADELIADSAALGGLELIGPIGEPFKPTPRAHKLRQRWRYAMPAQEHDIGSFAQLYDPALYQQDPAARWSAWQIHPTVEVDDAAGTVDLIYNAGAEVRHPAAIVPLNIVDDKRHRQAILRLGEWVAEHGIDAPGPWRAARDLLLRRAPRCGQADGADLRASGGPDEADREPDLDAAVRLAAALDAGTLAVQGPPGSGKTYAGARMIVRLLRDGKKVGISATSHKVIAHFLDNVCEAAEEAAAAGSPVELRAVQKVSDPAQGVNQPWVTVTTDNGTALDGLASGEFNLAAGTSWLWVLENATDAVDVLFIDEAGQVSLANVLAMSGAARSLVLLGDPQQLDQPLQGTHPPGADRSALAHFIGVKETMPRDRGLFMEHTWRLHPKITTYTSEAFYERRLESRPDLGRQRLDADAPMGGAGLHLVPAIHTGSDNESPEEAQLVADLVRSLVDGGGRWVDKGGVTHRLSYDDVLIVAPYNAQVGAIQAELPQARVGTVDKFQGQEAPVSIYSMTTSAPENAPRGMTFLYSRNRLNVATSRARCVTVVVASPELIRVRARTPEEMRLANALCQFVELAEKAES
jgi:predicted RecB family nuclease